MVATSLRALAVCAAAGVALLVAHKRGMLGWPRQARGVSQPHLDADLDALLAEDQREPGASQQSEEMSEEDMEELLAAFQDAAAWVTACGHAFSNDVKLAFYALYKQATVGKNTKSAPPLYDVVGRAKWQEWQKVSGLTASQAMIKYLMVAQKLIVDAQPEGASPGNKRDSSRSAAPSQGTWGPSQSTLGDMDGCSTDGPIGELCASARDGDVVGVQQLLHAGGDPNTRDAGGMSALMWAADRGCIEAALLLLDAGADANAADDDGQTALHYAATCGHEQMCKDLMQRGAKADAADADGQTPSDLRPRGWAWWPTAA